MKLLRFHDDDGAGLPRGQDATIAFTERERFRKAIWNVVRQFTHVALTDLLRDALYEIACGYHYWRQEDSDVEIADLTLRRLRAEAAEQSRKFRGAKR